MILSTKYISIYSIIVPNRVKITEMAIQLKTPNFQSQPNIITSIYLRMIL